MLVTEFPNINWLKRQIDQKFKHPRGLNVGSLPFLGWPTVLLNTKTKETLREDIVGPFSIFMNQSGASTIGVNQQQVTIHDNAYVISNRDEPYDLIIKEEVTTETFNIHFGTQFQKDAWFLLNNNNESLLDNPFDSKTLPPTFAFKATWRTEHFNQLVSQLKFLYQSTNSSTAARESILLELFEQVIFQQKKEVQQEQKLSSLKKSTKQELIKRLHLAVNYIYAHYTETISLEVLAQISCLSKFHFLRSFKQAFGLAPYQFIKKIRCEKAIDLLKNTSFSIQEIAFYIGIENASSFSRMIFKSTGQYPSAFRTN